MRTRIGLVQFPGSNCDADCIDAFKRHLGIALTPVWHTETALPQLDAVILPGGFSYGDYLRSGALASHSPVMASVKSFAAKGGAVLGICNGFQILTESHLPPGARLRNDHRQFRCEFVELATVDGASTYQKTLAGKTSRIPIAHGEGRYYVDADGLKRLQDKGQIVFRYAGANPNGSLDAIAGIVSENGRVMGMMPHPERATDVELGGSKDGLAILEAFLASFL
jgi:phosphoribosylformylglycinamidine synthase